MAISAALLAAATARALNQAANDAAARRRSENRLASSQTTNANGHEMTFPIPEGIPSAVTLPELRLLQEHAHEAGTVLEIGTHYGFTCIGMALAGAHVTSVDPHNEGPAGNRDTWEPFLHNLWRHNLPFAVIECSSRSVDPPMGLPVVNVAKVPIEQFHFEAPWRWGLVFIDGDHTWPAPLRDFEIAKAHLVEGGKIAFHDVTPRWPGVWDTVTEVQRQGWAKIAQVGTLAVYKRP